MHIKYDVFPAHLAAASHDLLEDPLTLSSKPTTEGAYYLQTTRVVLTESHVIVVQDSPQGAMIVFRETYTPENFHKGANQEVDSIVVTTGGKVLAFKKDTNCGCGSRLRGWNPYKTLHSIKD
jgi:hypothetical protein